MPLVPNTFTNLKFTINWETESGESGINLNYVIDEDTVKIHHLYGTSEAFWAEESFTWEESGHNTISSKTTNADGRVVVGSLTFQDADSGTFELKFYESENGQLVYKESGIGTFTIEEYSVAELPTTKGWMGSITTHRFIQILNRIGCTISRLVPSCWSTVQKILSGERWIEEFSI